MPGGAGWACPEPARGSGGERRCARGERPDLPEGRRGHPRARCWPTTARTASGSGARSRAPPSWCRGRTSTAWWRSPGTSFRPTLAADSVPATPTKSATPGRGSLRRGGGADAEGRARSASRAVPSPASRPVRDHHAAAMTTLDSSIGATRDGGAPTCRARRSPHRRRLRLGRPSRWGRCRGPPRPRRSIRPSRRRRPPVPVMEGLAPSGAGQRRPAGHRRHLFDHLLHFRRGDLHQRRPAGGAGRGRRGVGPAWRLGGGHPPGQVPRLAQVQHGTGEGHRRPRAGRQGPLSSPGDRPANRDRRPDGRAAGAPAERAGAARAHRHPVPPRHHDHCGRGPAGREQRLQPALARRAALRAWPSAARRSAWRSTCVHGRPPRRPPAPARWTVTPVSTRRCSCGTRPRPTSGWPPAAST